ncbi:MAG: hypothetical protein AAF828_04590 [Bacteroidota bacterium]
MRFYLLCCLLLASYFVNLNAQAGNPAQAGEATLDVQFDEMVAKSNRYQKFRVVPYAWLQAFQSNLQDSLAVEAEKVIALRNEIEEQSATIATQLSTIEEREATIAQLEAEKDGISLFGNLMSKTLYSTILWGTIAALLAGLVFFLARGRLALASSRQLQADKTELTAELEKSRKQRLKIEQDLRRKLQDEINKRG